MLNMPLGGIPVFFINGLSGGFGYNRDLVLPDVNDVVSYPMVAGLDNPAIMGSSPTDAINSMADYMPASRGDYWFAGGLKWTT